MSWSGVVRFTAGLIVWSSSLPNAHLLAVGMFACAALFSVHDRIESLQEDVRKLANELRAARTCSRGDRQSHACDMSSGRELEGTVGNTHGSAPVVDGLGENRGARNQ